MNYVYYFKNFNDEIIYVGKTGHLKRRMKDHFTKGHLPVDCYAQIDRIFIAETGESKYDTEICETLLINKYKPKYNKEKKFNEQSTKTNYTLMNLQFKEIFYDYRTNTISKNKIRCRCFDERNEYNRAKFLLEDNLLLLDKKKDTLKYLMPSVLGKDDTLNCIIKIYKNAINHIDVNYSILDESVTENDDLFDNYTAFNIKAIQESNLDIKTLLKIANYGFIFRINDDIYGIPLLRKKLLQKMVKNAI